MDEALRRMLRERDEGALDEAYYDEKCPHFFAVDWREDEADIVAYCADCLDIHSLRAEWRDDSLVIFFDGRETLVPLANDVVDREHVILSTLNDALQPKFEIRLLVCTMGSDTYGYAALPTEDWQLLDREFPQATEENFIKLRDVPNLLADGRLPDVFEARYKRMLERDRNSQ